MHFHETGLNKLIFTIIVGVNGPWSRETSEWFNACAPKMIKSAQKYHLTFSFILINVVGRHFCMLYVFHSVVLCVMAVKQSGVCPLSNLSCSAAVERQSELERLIQALLSHHQLSNVQTPLCECPHCEKVSTHLYWTQCNYQLDSTKQMHLD